MYQQSYYCLWIHLIWATKKRQLFLTNDIRFKVYDFIRDKAKEIEVHLDHINGVEDHVHTLISIKPKQSISNVAKSFKGASSRWVNETGLIDEHFDWQEGFSAFSVSPSHVQRVREYIRNQEKHHKRFGFDRELVMLEEKAAKMLG